MDDFDKFIPAPVYGMVGFGLGMLMLMALPAAVLLEGALRPVARPVTSARCGECVRLEEERAKRFGKRRAF